MYKFLKPVTSHLPDIRSFGSHLNWIVLLLVNLLIIVSLRHELITPELRNWAPHLTLNMLLVGLLFWGRYQIGPVDRPSFLPLLIKLCTLTGVGVLVVLFLEAIMALFSGSRLVSDPFFATMVYSLEVLAGGAVLTGLLIGFKRLILFEKTRLMMITWRLFEYALVTTTVLSLFNIQFQSLGYNIIIIGLSGLGILLSVHLKWVGYLDFRQKVQALGVLLVQLVCLLIFAFFMYFYAADAHLLFHAVDNMLLVVLLIFALIATTFSVLVIFFNLPTSSVFEKKLEDLNGIKQLQQSLRKRQSEADLYQLLLQGGLKATDAQWGWVAIQREGDELRTHQPDELPAQSISSLIAAISDAQMQKWLRGTSATGRKKSYYLLPVQHPVYKSALVVPLRIQETLCGHLVLLKNVPEGFNKDAVGIARLFAEQTCLSVENLLLLDEALRSERYQEEMAIARRVKASLLPDSICCNADCQLAVCSQSADDVGGDYYDAYRLDEDRVALVVADVSGHGSSAAFTMSQLKGVFHSLVPQGLSCSEFLLQANSALSRGLGRTTFVTLVYGVLDRRSRTFTFVRAGHCPVIHYSQKSGRLSQLGGKGMGLGLLRNNSYQEHIEEQTIAYGPGDALLLYTDGIIECRNAAGEEFGQERLLQHFGALAAQPQHSAQEVCTQLQEALADHAGLQQIQDDHTTLVLKFS
ncbi:SpoIIE family protein phosphatase [Cesiribacter andamanensis]|uniref:Phosphoserine phosphatase rsbU n=1 Tax=Cesiribacter andamanensis AMV16 TaxID=1279009 RepID=M7N1W3_9BACT|nr:SpoIIE family protein phosphatase [Cesiribacter andamanensis]EMR02673.1 Phosphoserine phosphatase rsbU [Cesiribacter andamanensis AMV16]